ncbi:MAG: hypothetical protein ACJ8LG_21575 [Massilia sp.]
MNTQVKTLSLTLTPAQLGVILTGLEGERDAARKYVDSLVATKSGKTALANYWRDQLAAAEQALAIVRSVC